MKNIRIRRSTGWALGLGIGLPAAVFALGSGLLRVQSSRLRRAVELDSRRPIPQLAAVVSPQETAVVPLPSDGSAEEFPALAVIGDSWLAGLGVGRRQRTPGLLLARGLARLLEEPVRVLALAQPSARAEDIARQVSELLADHRLRRSRTPGREHRYAVIAMGTADLVHPLSASIGIPVLSAVINRLQREGGYRVLVLTCPNLGGLPGIPRPLRDVLRRTSRVLSGSQWLTAVSTGALPVSVNRSLAATTEVGLISLEGRYPSPLGYAQLSAAVLRRIAEDLELPSTVDPTAEEPDP